VLVKPAAVWLVERTATARQLVVCDLQGQRRLVCECAVSRYRGMTQSEAAAGLLGAAGLRALGRRDGLAVLSEAQEAAAGAAASVSGVCFGRAGRVSVRAAPVCSGCLPAALAEAADDALVC